ncbi:TIGR04283 family arsenosugar biosynthesis glycosyltransferase [Salegentibacter sp. JZCK2]|uniref:TIGR04283 family arsenosugar biosynthesis glycosyltransferase n=1 Tax=Salegentibacter tibetensis TaxID=2873600 RepID=UPI001CCF6749|nr:TIGR04283 family arsenosugar biosynthesis glycosyltransferase [Salegentibacter tibetensis]MBZ9730867.1 TIGR04283 family arsenosugar biosynthesis glycosyltransferase [Salegentibacter tibetensis]
MVQVQNIKISIIIPCLNEASFLEKTIGNCLKLQGNFEIIVVDGGSGDNTVGIARSFSIVKIFTSKKGRASQLNFGAKEAEGEVLLFLHADTFLPENTYSLITEQLEKSKHIGGSFRLRIDKLHPLLNLYSWCSRFSLEFFTYGDHAIFVKQEIFKSIGGFKTISFMEDIEIQRRLRKRGKFKKVKDYVLTSGRRFEKNGTFKQLALDVFLVCLYNLSIHPNHLKRFYSDHG